MKWLLLSFCIFSHLAFAFVPGGDNDYFILIEDQYRIIFDKQYLNSIDQINQKVKKQMDSMSKFKKRTLDEPINIILLSPKSQISNAFATVIPFYTIGMYPTGVLGLTRLSEPLWFDGVFEHELNHVFQMSHSKYPLIWRKIFRLPSVLWFLIIQRFSPYPNIFLPRFVLEGDAILKESLDRNGGRLYDGAVRAFVYSQIRHYQHKIDKFTEQKLLRFTFNNPHSGREIYLHGGYIMAMLAEKYSQDTIHSFFKVNRKKPSKKEIKIFKEDPIRKKLSPHFEKIFSFQHIRPFVKDIVKTYFNRYLSEASQQRYSTTPVLFESAECTPFNTLKDELFFLTSDFKFTPTLNIFNKKEKKWTDKKIDLPLGKVFKIDNKYYSRSTQRVAPNTIHYSLFSKGLRSNKKFDSKYVTDIKNNKVLSIDTKNNLNSFKLYLNDKFYTNVHSEALFDKNENIYYLKQKGNRRTLYKNKTALFSYKGYYGHLLEIDRKGAVYFTGASQYGSSIYQYKSGKITRVSSSDTVIQAQKINDKEFIVCEVTPYKYEYKITPLVKINERPAFYKYNFKQNKSLASNNVSKDSFKRDPASQKNQKSIVLKTEKDKSSKKSSKPEQTSLDYKPYSALQNIRFGGGQLIAASLGLFSLFGASAVISDYLLQNLIQLSLIGSLDHWDPIRGEFGWNKGNFNIFHLDYINKIYSLNWRLGYTSQFTTDHIHKQLGYLILSYPTFREGRWSASITSIHSIKQSLIYTIEIDNIISRLQTELKEEHHYVNTFSSRGVLNISYSQSFPFNYLLSNKSARLKFFVDHQYSYSKEPQWNGWKGGIIGNSTWHIGQDFYVMPAASYALSLNDNINPVEIHSYSMSLPQGFDQQKKTAFLDSNILYSDDTTDDTTTESFVPFDMYSSIFQRRYLAKSISTASMGLKKMFSSPSNIITASVRSRWIVLEQLFSTEPLPIAPGENTTIDQSRTYISGITDLIKQLGPRDQKKLESTYIHWLEWTFGLEYLALLQHNSAIVIGGAFGFRTPLKFWENNESKTDNSDDSDDSYVFYRNSPPSQRINLNQAFNPTNVLNNASIQFYVKIPF